MTTPGRFHFCQRSFNQSEHDLAGWLSDPITVYERNGYRLAETEKPGRWNVNISKRKSEKETDAERNKKTFLDIVDCLQKGT